MSKVALELNLNWLVEHFGAVQQKERFTWVLGAGASSASRIPLGSQLVDFWLAELHSRKCTDHTKLESWANAKELRIKYFNWDDRASFYPQIYQRRFEVLPKEGYDYLESVMAHKEPSPGYAILAAILAAGRHNVVITTNFDNLVSDAVSTYTDSSPLVIGHESLAGFANEFLERPLICKIHRDLLLNPQNDSRSLVRLHESWAPALRALFRNYTPIFIGYGGNDATLMGLLESLEPREIKPGLIWCYYGEKPDDRIVQLVADLDGSLVRTPDFDLLMFLLGHEMGITTLENEIERRAAQRTKRYRDRIIQLDLDGHEAAARAVAATMERAGGWWREYQKTRTETDREKRRTAFENAINLHSDSAVLRGLFANFMRDEFKDFEAAGKLYVQALDIDEDDATIKGDYAYMHELSSNNYEAERLYKWSLELDPRNAMVANRFANFLWYEKDEPDRAGEWYLKAAKLNPTNADTSVDLATFVWNHLGSFVQADVAYRNALNLAPNGLRALTSYAAFCLSRENYDVALRQIDKALQLNQGRRNQFAAILCFYEAIVLKIKKEDNSTAIRQLDALLKEGFRRHRWRFDKVLDLIEVVLPDRFDFFSNLAKPILKSPSQTVLEDMLGGDE